VVDVLDHELLDRPGDLADATQRVDAGERQLAFADELLGALGELEELDAGGHPLLGPAQRLGGAVLSQAAVEHRLDRARLLVGVQLLARD